jgi:cellulose 1,4-beta-cellobiosidase
VAVKFDIYNNAGEGTDSTGMYLDGAVPTVPAVDMTSSGVSLLSGDVMNVQLSYNGTTLTLTITDASTLKSFTTNFTVNIPTTVGNTTALVGFTGGTGGLTAIQDVLSWTYSTGSSTSPPAAPTNLVATAGNGQVGLSWSASGGTTSYNVKRSTTSGGAYTTIASPTTASYTDTGLTNGTTYYYVVSAVNGAGESANSSQVSATPQPAIPPAPTNLVATAGNGQVGLSWSASSGATSYNVKRSTTSGGAYTTIASPTTTSYTDTGVTNGTTYYYVVSAVNTAGQSANSSQVSATPTASTMVINYGSGFSSSGLQLNGSTKLNGTRLRLTDGGGGEASSAFYSTPVNVQSFTTNFSFQMTSAAADGMTFVIQNGAATALGTGGGGLG